MTHTYDNFLPNLKEASVNLIIVLFMFKLPIFFFSLCLVIKSSCKQEVNL